jgi:hypothetical protein
MTEILRAKGKQINLPRPSDGGEVELRATLDGSLITAPWYVALLLEGVLFGTNSGTGTSPDTGSATYVATTPDLAVDTVAGIAMIPMSITLGLDMAWASETDSEAIAAVSNTLSDASGGQGITNLRTDSPRGSQCAAEVGTVTDVTGGSNYFEFFRESLALPGAVPAIDGIAVLSMFRWTALKTLPPIIVGAGSLVCWMAANGANDVFATAIWAELPATAIP